MEPQDVEHVKKIIRDEVDSALETKAREIELRMIATTTTFQNEIRQEVRTDHAENRTRMQLIDDKAKEAVEQARLGAREATKAVAGNEFILKRMDKQDEEAGQARRLMQNLISEVKGWAGRREGEHDANVVMEKQHEKWVGWAVKVGTVLASGGVYRWLASKFHWIGGR